MSTDANEQAEGAESVRVHRPKKEGVYFDLMDIRWFKWLVKWRGFQFILQAIGLAAFGVIVYAGLYGTPDGGSNVGSTFTWLIWWTLIPVTMLLAARGWCLICPWIAPAEWLQRLSLWQKGKRTLSLNWKVPKFMRNFGVMLFLFLVLHWADSTFHLALRPETTVYLALGMFAMAIVVSLLFEKRSFCRYFCPIGAIIAPYSLAAPIELRNKDDEVCRKCRTRDCVKGNDKGYACPQMIHPYAIERNTHCVMCMECAKTCPSDNISVNVRRPFQDLFSEGVGFLRSKTVPLSLSIIAIVLLGIIPFHNLEMTSAYASFEGSVADSVGVSADVVRTVAFLMTGTVLVLIFLGVSSIVRRTVVDSPYRVKHIFIWFALAFIPLAISLHLAHNYFHLIQEGGAAIIPSLSDPFGFGWDLFGTADSNVVILSSTTIQVLQFVTIGFGVLASTYVLYRLTRNMFQGQAAMAAVKVMAPMMVFLITLGVFYTWVLTIPMSMRF